MGKIKQLVTVGLLALVTSVAFAIPSPSDAAQKSVKKRATATKQVQPKAALRRSAARSTKRVVRIVPERPSFGQIAGLRSTDDDLALASSVAFVVDQDSNEVLLSKNSDAVLPIASITKLMTALVVTEAKLPLDEMLSIGDEDVDTEKGSRSRLRVGTELSREEMLHLSLIHI